MFFLNQEIICMFWNYPDLLSTEEKPIDTLMKTYIDTLQKLEDARNKNDEQAIPKLRSKLNKLQNKWSDELYFGQIDFFHNRLKTLVPNIYFANLKITQLPTSLGGEIPLHLAARKYDVEAVTYLCAKGSHIETKNNKDQTPFDVLLEELADDYKLELSFLKDSNNAVSCAQILINRGAKIHNTQALESLIKWIDCTKEKLKLSDKENNNDIEKIRKVEELLGLCASYKAFEKSITFEHCSLHLSTIETKLKDASLLEKLRARELGQVRYIMKREQTT